MDESCHTYGMDVSCHTHEEYDAALEREKKKREKERMRHVQNMNESCHSYG